MYMHLGHQHESVYKELMVLHIWYTCNKHTNRCTETSNSACQALYPVDYEIALPSHVEQEVFDIVTVASTSLDDFCINVLKVMACRFLHPPCTREGTPYKCAFFRQSNMYTYNL